MSPVCTPLELRGRKARARPAADAGATAMTQTRWHVERCFEDEKTELGMDHFEVRTYRAMMRHLALRAMSHLFVARVHQKLKKTPATDRLPSPYGGECVFDCAGETRSKSATVSGTGVAGDNKDAAAHRQSGAQSPQENVEASAPCWSLCVPVTTL